MQFMFSRKSGIVLAALLGVQLILPASGWALTGRDVALKADQVDTSRTSDTSMAMIIKRGDQQLVRFMTMKKKKFPDSESSTSAFSNRGTSGIRPISRGVTGISTKTMTCGFSTCPPSRWSAASAEAAKKGSFMRSDYANEDISRAEVDKDTYTLLPDEALSGVDCHVLR